MIKGKWEPLEVTKKRIVVPESLLRFAKREIRTQPCSLGWEGPGRSCKFNLDDLSSWEGNSDRILTRHHPRHAGSLNPRNSDLGGCVLAVNARARQCTLRHQGILKFISVSAYHTGVWGHSVQFSRSVMSDSLWPHESQHARPPCPSPTPGVHPNSCASSRWCHPAISSSVVRSPSPQSFPASGSFPMSQLFTWGGQSIGVSASASVLSVNTQDWSSLGELVGSPCSPRDSQESSPTPQFKSINSLALSFLHSPTLTCMHDY